MHHQPCPAAAAALLDALYAALNNIDVAKGLLEFIHSNIDRTHRYASHGQVGSFWWFIEELKGVSPPAMLHAAACLGRLCQAEISLQSRDDSSNADQKGLQEGSFCHTADKSNVFVLVMLAIRSGLRVSDAAPTFAASHAFCRLHHHTKFAVCQLACKHNRRLHHYLRVCCVPICLQAQSCNSYTLYN